MHTCLYITVIWKIFVGKIFSEGPHFPKLNYLGIAGSSQSSVNSEVQLFDKLPASKTFQFALKNFTTFSNINYYYEN